MINKLENYLNNKEYKMIIDEKSIYIINYKRLISLEENFISVLTKNKKIQIKGERLILKKILDNELLIEGLVKNIEVINEQ